MINLVLTRIDDRLIHGQVMTAWVKYTSAERIIIVDDDVYENDFLKKVMEMAAPPGIDVDIYNIQLGTEELLKKDERKTILLIKFPFTVEALYENGVKFEEVIVGGMAAEEGRKKFYKNISVSEDEKEIFRRLVKKGVKVNIRIVPDNRPVSVEKFL